MCWPLGWFMFLIFDFVFYLLENGIQQEVRSMIFLFDFICFYSLKTI